MTEEDFTRLFARVARETTRKDLGEPTLDAKISSFGIDSVAMLEIVSALEEELGARLADDQLSRVRRVRDLYDLFEQARQRP